MAPGEVATERLRLRIARAEMGEAMADFLRSNWEGHLARWSPPVGPAFFDPAFWRERLARAGEELAAGTAARFVLQAPGPASAPVLGTCNYTNIVRGPFQACYLGYQIDRGHEGRGLMAEALRALNAFAFRELRLHRIMANYRPENARSARLLERLGFVREGLAKDYLFIDGAWRDHVLTALTNPGFDPAGLDIPGRHARP